MQGLADLKENAGRLRDAGSGAVLGGEDHQKIAGWIKNGWLQDRLQGTRRHDGSGKNIHGSREKGHSRLHQEPFPGTQSRQSRPSMVFGLGLAARLGTMASKIVSCCRGSRRRFSRVSRGPLYVFSLRRSSSEVCVLCKIGLNRTTFSPVTILAECEALIASEDF